MPYAPLKLPPGVFRPGTKYDAKGRWYVTNLVRWHENAMQPIGGWQALEETNPSVQQIDLTGRCCGMLAWRANDESAQLVVGTPTLLYHFASGVLADITPTGFTTGNSDAELTAAIYGNGAYGAGLYGTGDPAQSTLIEAQNWAIDNFGEDVVAVAYSDGLLYYFDTSAGTAAVAVSSGATVAGGTVDASAPTDGIGVVVTPERFVVVLGADGDGRLVKWADQESVVTWASTTTNQAGSFPLVGAGQLMAGRRSRTETLLWTDTDLWAMRYIGGQLVYSFNQVGAACGVISRRGMAVVDGKALWMGARSFYRYDGFTQPLPCDVGDYVFSDMNRTQASKVWADVRSEYSEVTWYYPSAGSTECDRYVTYNYAAGHWFIGELERTAGVDRGAFPYPIMADADGLLYQHEVGTEYDSLVPYAESGPVEIAQGDNVMCVLGLIPDERTLGDVELSLIAAMYPTADETTHGPYSMANPTSVRITARQVRLKASQVAPGWRLGTPRLEVQAGGLR